MQQILVEKPYKFIPPHRGTWWSTIIRDLQLQNFWLRRQEGVCGHEVRGQQHLRRSLDAGHGILLTPNHCRNADPLVMGWLAKELKFHVFAMASWHLFHNSRFEAWAIRRMGGFSVYREGVDRPAINTAIEILDQAERPLVIFPEGAVSRTNDHLHALLDGVSFIARTAAKRRAKRLDGGRVVVHPVALKYLFEGDFDTVADPVLTEIEHRLSWQPQTDLPMNERIAKVGLALLSLKELEYFGESFSDTLAERMSRLTNRLLEPLERQWLGAEKTGPVVPRVKTLRMKILPDMVQGRVSPTERQARWRQLADLYLAQQISNYPPNYLDQMTVDRLRETIERFEEDLTDRARAYSPIKVIIEVGAPIDVSPQRDRNAEVDPLMAAIERELQHMLDRLAAESPLYQSKN
jgi:1-acyl-sn-glycerol-3-phosphate acyltransferase